MAENEKFFVNAEKSPKVILPSRRIFIRFLFWCATNGMIIYLISSPNFIESIKQIIKKLFTQIEFHSVLHFAASVYDFRCFSSILWASPTDPMSLSGDVSFYSPLQPSIRNILTQCGGVKCSSNHQNLYLTFRFFHCFFAGHGGVNQLGGVFVNGKSQFRLNCLARTAHRQHFQSQL